MGAPSTRRSRASLRNPPAFIGQEITPDSRRLLQDGTMTLLIDQNAEGQALHAVAVLMHHFGFEEAGHVAFPYASPVAFTIHGPDNV